MAGQRSIGSPKTDQPGIHISATNINSPLTVETSTKNNNKRPRTSPKSEQQKRLALESNSDATSNIKDCENQIYCLPPDLKLLYVSLTKMMDKKCNP